MDLEVLFSYELRDLILFTPESYFRLIELHNAQWWPAAQMISLCLLAAIALFRHKPDKLIISAGTCLAFTWLLLGATFFTRFGELFDAARAIAWLFVIEASLLLFFAIRWRHRASLIFNPPALALLFYALFVHPLLSITSDRSLGSIELFGLSPDPTVLASIALILSIRHPRRWLVLVIPLLWSISISLVYIGMEVPSALTSHILMAALLTASLHRRKRSRA